MSRCLRTKWSAVPDLAVTTGVPGRSFIENAYDRMINLANIRRASADERRLFAK